MLKDLNGVHSFSVLPMKSATLLFFLQLHLEWLLKTCSKR